MDEFEKLERDIYRRCLETAKAYYRMLKRQGEIEKEILYASGRSDGQPRKPGPGDPTGNKALHILSRKIENERKIKAVEQAWSIMADECEKDFIRKNLFEHVPMQYINLPMGLRTMKRCRRKFLITLAINLNEI